MSKIHTLHASCDRCGKSEESINGVWPKGWIRLERATFGGPAEWDLCDTCAEDWADFIINKAKDA